MNEQTATEIERKYIVVTPSLSALQAEEDFTESEIRQTYLAAPEGVTHRVRARTKNGKTVYTETVKVRIDALSCEETEGEIDRKTYEERLARIAHGTRTIVKTRYTFRRGEQIFELDVYPEWKKTCILETELKSRDDRAVLPEFLTVVREVTGDFSYSNAAMACKMPQESVSQGADL